MATSVVAWVERQAAMAHRMLSNSGVGQPHQSEVTRSESFCTTSAQVNRILFVAIRRGGQHAGSNRTNRLMPVVPIWAVLGVVALR
jgi:hypothetical protein